MYKLKDYGTSQYITQFNEIFSMALSNALLHPELTQITALLCSEAVSCLL